MHTTVTMLPQRPVFGMIRCLQENYQCKLLMDYGALYYFLTLPLEDIGYFAEVHWFNRDGK